MRLTYVYGNLQEMEGIGFQEKVLFHRPFTKTAEMDQLFLGLLIITVVAGENRENKRSLEGSLYKKKTVHRRGTSISQGEYSWCECVSSVAVEEFQNLLRTYKAEIQNDCGQRVSSLEQNLRSEISQQKQAIEAFGQRITSLEQSLRSEMSSMIAVISKNVQQLSANCSRMAQEKTVCPPVFTLIHDHCYYFSPDVMNNWYEASKLCQKLDPRAALAKIETATEWDFLKTYLLKEKSTSSKLWWIGGSDQDYEGHWTWMGSNQLLTYIPWCNSQPDNAGGDENCLHIWGGNDPLCWNDAQCAENRYNFQLNFICEI